MKTRSKVAGFSLIELMVSIAIGLFLLLAIYTIFATVRTTLRHQTASSQLQDDQLVASSILANVTQSAGFFPAPGTVTKANAFPVITPFVSAGQVVSGTHQTSAPGDTMTLRFIADTASPSKTINCVGSFGSAGLIDVDRLAITSGEQLGCSVGGSSVQPLVGALGSPGQGILNMQVLYGIDGTGTHSVSRYMTADAVTAANQWNAVLSADITLTFRNPNAGHPGEPDTITLSRAVVLENTL